MITDERLDQVVRQALEWHAERATARQPALHQQQPRRGAAVTAQPLPRPQSSRVCGRADVRTR